MTINEVFFISLNLIKDEPINDNNLEFLKDIIERKLMNLTGCPDCKINLYYDHKNAEIVSNSIRIGNLEIFERRT